MESREAPTGEVTQPRPAAIFLLGPPASGKGTQAQALSALLGFRHIAASSLIREAIERGEGGEVERRQFARGELVNPGWTASLVASAFHEAVRAGNGVIADGSLRTQEEAVILIPLVKKLFGGNRIAVLYLHISDDEVRRRSSSRLVCSGCGQPLLPGTVREGEICPDRVCGGVVERRGLDNPATVERRVREYHERTVPVLEYLEREGVLRRTNGEQTPQQVTQSLVAAVQPLFSA